MEIVRLVMSAIVTMDGLVLFVIYVSIAYVSIILSSFDQNENMLNSRNKEYLIFQS